jgi:hypothetical protein
LLRVHDFVRETNSADCARQIGSAGKAALLEQVERFDLVFNIFGPSRGTVMLDAEIQALIDERQAARKAQQFRPVGRDS